MQCGVRNLESSFLVESIQTVGVCSKCENVSRSGARTNASTLIQNTHERMQKVGNIIIIIIVITRIQPTPVTPFHDDSLSLKNSLSLSIVI